jgi:TfoX/Sxy family transcriptional regulator of competence genes
MSEYLLYYNGILFGGIYDDRLLIKKLEINKKYNLKEEIPYDGAKPMYYIENTDNIELLKEIIVDTYNGLIK